MCNAHVPFPNSAVNPPQLFVNSKRILQYRGDDRVAEVDQYYTVLARISSALDNIFLIVGLEFGITEEVVDDLRQQLEDQQYVCTFSNKWESISVTFNLTLPAGILLVVLLYTYLYYNYLTCLMPGCTNIECTQFLCWCSC